ncbi:MAG: transcriptional repressor [bacterium]|nr:transcriptional repressor [bacterium]
MRKDILGFLKENKVKITDVRQEIIAVLEKTKLPLTPAAVFFGITTKLPKANLTSVYRNLEMLEGLNLVKRLSFDKNGFSYELVSDRPHHHHVVCRNCGKLEDLSSLAAEEFVEKTAQKTNFKIEDHNLEFFGLCRECKNES